jgi:mRNA interferase MazF
MVKNYIPDRGDIIWLHFHPQSGREHAGHRPALVLSPKIYNQKVGLCLVCPITSKINGYPFEVVLAKGLKISGAILSDQVRSLDWISLKAEYIEKVPDEIFFEVKGKLDALIQG